MNISKPCDVWIPGSSFGAKHLTGAEAVAWLKAHSNDNAARITVRPWEASAEDHEALRSYQVDLMKAGRGFLPF